MREDFAQLDTPLIERIDVPDGSLRENGMLVNRHQLAEHFRRELFCEDRVRRPIALKNAMRDEPVWRPLCLDLLCRFPKCQRLGLGEHIC